MKAQKLIKNHFDHNYNTMIFDETIFACLTQIFVNQLSIFIKKINLKFDERSPNEKWKK
jgi:hypothetical protein